MGLCFFFKAEEAKVSLVGCFGVGVVVKRRWVDQTAPPPHPPPHPCGWCVWGGGNTAICSSSSAMATGADNASEAVSAAVDRNVFMSFSLFDKASAGL